MIHNNSIDRSTEPIRPLLCLIYQPPQSIIINHILGAPLDSHTRHGSIVNSIATECRERTPSSLLCAMTRGFFGRTGKGVLQSCGRQRLPTVNCHLTRVLSGTRSPGKNQRLMRFARLFSFSSSSESTCGFCSQGVEGFRWP